MIDFTVRISVFLLVFSALIIWQWYWPRAPLLQWKQRWRHNLSLLLIGALCVRLFQPLLLSVMAFFSQEFGLFNALNLPFIVAFLLSIVVLDGLIYWQHRLFHRVPFLWRFHRVHHSDPELDVSSAVRFHPIEILMSLGIKVFAIWLLGIPIEAVLAFDILLNASAMFNHTNARLPEKVEVWVKKILVTPDMHRIHHSRVSLEANSNYGFFLSIWDSLFRSKRNHALNGDENLTIGLPETRSYQPASFKAVLALPFKSFKKSR
jgi:sterol desaturase/sphingolipid hydroxylase (fatty acid hydroxylase superfamily)